VTRARLGDALAVLGVTLLTALLGQRWAGLDTPDSSFYLSLGLFGDEVAQRAVEPAYYWTRLGAILPTRALSEVLGTGAGLAALRGLLLLIVVASVYCVVRRITGRPAATVLTALLALNTVLLSYLGNPYVTAASFAGLALAIAGSLGRGVAPAVAAGAGLGWLVMIHPQAALLGATVWVALGWHGRRPVRAWLVSGAVAVGVAAAFWGVGRLAFPGRDWLGTLLDWNSRLQYDVFASESPVWIQDISLLVPVLGLALAVIAWARQRTAPWAQQAVVVSASSIGFMLVFSPLQGGVPLEAPMYQATLWLPTLMVLALVLGGWMEQDAGTWRTWVLGAVAVAAVALAGRTSFAVPLLAGWVVVVALIVLTVLRPARSAAAALGLATLLLASAQVLQNARGNLGLYYLSPYSWAFVDNPVAQKVRTAINAQEWLLAQTTADDRILSWVDGDWVGGDRELYVVAGMQLWGENRVGLSPTLTPEEAERMRELRPSVVQLVGRSMPAVLAYWSSLPREARAQPPVCYDFAWPSETVPVGHSCLARLDWA
jgi:hypothetical protein